MSWEREDIIAPFVIERGLYTRGFLAQLRALVEEFTEAEDGEPRKRTLGGVFGEWFGDLNTVPAAFSIERCGDGISDVTVHVYEVELSARISDAKMAQYGRAADGDGPCFELHVIDRIGNERCVDNDQLCMLALRSRVSRVQTKNRQKGRAPGLHAPAFGNERVRRNKENRERQRLLAKAMEDLMERSGVTLDEILSDGGRV